MARRGGRLLLIETSSKPNYAPTIEFYKRNGYHLEARIRDYYRPGDDKLIFAKEIRDRGDHERHAKAIDDENRPE